MSLNSLAVASENGRTKDGTKDSVGADLVFENSVWIRKGVFLANWNISVTSFGFKIDAHSYTSREALEPACDIAIFLV